MNKQTRNDSQQQRTDEWLIQQYKEGNEGAMQELVERHRPFVLTCICRTVSDRYLAEDIAQDVWLKVFRSLHTYRGDAKFTTWLYRLTRNQMIDTLRKWKHQHIEMTTDTMQHVEGQIDLDLIWSDLPEDRLITRERSQEVLEVLKQLPMKYRTVMVLYHLRDRSYTEIAEQLSMPVRTVETRLYRAKSLFKRAWGQSLELA
ncbi:MAG: sigma-70 family RNA polymerase sigma factor [Paenibacillus sp.]|uniref:RNA polymerase, sigma-24 subunit, RpoE n=1 Tax=Paenibacillus aquistagni TaxID=1852522 RepID=A0A1X7LRM0_9BACL|nr:sigma-70 family RNA polymerase sigma factor [Paenibacillus aquistagni]MBR2569393.1 sigma-70 family RNA polymerase sigma factor [Paenibacillus sp.]NMM55551.1 sigma-70 family RNA polymerase sigma factor [Paenibacillus aquistagni]SMG55983.1 RNA polymerase, sigma-24 subunit, RpoE [Paenibacillus aquistagni]